MKIAAIPLVLALAAATPQAAPQDDGYGDAYPADEVFARIARHAPPYQPSQILYEDPDVMAFADYAPLSPGHMLVIARRSRARSLIDIPPATLAKLMAVARRVMIAQRDALGANGAAILISNGSFQSVPHLHVHVIPHYRGASLHLDAKPPRASDAELAAVVARLTAAMPRTASTQ